MKISNFAIHLGLNWLDIHSTQNLLLNWFIWILVVNGNNDGILARLHNGTIQLINLNVHSEWSDYCHNNNYYYYYGGSYHSFRASLTRMFSVTCRVLGYEAYSSYTRNKLMCLTNHVFEKHNDHFYFVENNYGRFINRAYSTYVVHCQGNETSLNDCGIAYFSVPTCRTFYHVTCQQCE